MIGIVNVPRASSTGTASFFDIDTQGGIMPAETVAWDKNFETDDNNDIQPKEE